MRKLILLTLTFVALQLVHSADKYTLLQNGQEAPNFTFQKDTTTMNFFDYKGKVVLVNFFATWCPPCKKELPLIKSDIWDKHKNNSDFELMIVGREHSPAQLRKFKAERGYDFSFYADKNKKIFESFAKDIIPRSYVIDKNGIIVYQALGFNEEEFKKMVMVVDSLLAK
ncbi:MAG: TlpA family protein disulfide reductase [Paludibacteraceae bacterium]|nr:TlpA family protein disulfide reductase [Paludibacteraceae bacterium]MBN2787381.1 TlpA family protein disulfide reductase [Paludibacteraceae bacterium]